MQSKHINHTPLTNDQIVSLAPSTGASAPHDAVSSKYSFVPTIQAVDILRSAGWLPIDAEQSSVRIDDRKGFQKHRIRFMHESLDPGQERIDLVMVNSHDRGCAFQLSASIWRKTCGNGLMVSTDAFTFSHKHINFDDKAFSDSAYMIADGAAEISNQIDTFKTIDLSQNERGIYAMAAHKLVYEDIDTAPIQAGQLLEERRYDDEGKDLWTTFNVVQENLIKGGLNGRKRDSKGRLRYVRTRPVKSIDRDMRLNRSLWLLTKEMERLKKKYA